MLSISGSLPAQCELQEFTSPVAEADDVFGWTCFQRESRMIIGAIGEDDACPTDPNCLSGAVYVYEWHSTGGFRLVTRLTASDAAQGFQFGNSVGIDGEFAVVGSHFNGTGGAAYVLQRVGGTWIETQKLVGSQVQSNFHFGHSVNILFNTILIGSMRDNHAGNESGSAYIYGLDNSGSTVFMESGYLTASDAGPGDRFGRSSALGQNFAVVAAHLHDGVGTDSGKVYVYERVDPGTPFDPNDDTWPEVAALTASDGGAEHWFGRSVSIHEDTLVVGASRAPGAGVDRGAVYVFERIAGTWTEVQILRADDATDNDRFGIATSVFGDRILIGAKQQSEAAPNAGAAYVFDRTSSGWVQTSKLITSTAAADDFLGDEVSVSVWGSRALVSAWASDAAVSNGGAAYLFDLKDCLGTSPCASLPNSSGAVGRLSAFGSTIVERNDFGLRAEDCAANKPGIFFLGANTNDVPFGDGRLCVGNPIQRIQPIVMTDAAGNASRPFDLTTQPALGLVATGLTHRFQFWFRDGTGGPAGHNLTDSLSVVWK